MPWWSAFRICLKNQVLAGTSSFRKIIVLHEMHSPFSLCNAFSTSFIASCLQISQLFLLHTSCRPVVDLLLVPKTPQTSPPSPFLVATHPEFHFQGGADSESRKREGFRQQKLKQACSYWGRCEVKAKNMMKNVSYALPLLGKFSRVDAMSHWYKATEICRRKKKAAEHTLFIYPFFFWK